MRYRRMGILSLALLSPLLVLGCGSVPTTHYYVLALSPSGEMNSGLEGPSLEGTSLGGTSLGVETFSVDPPYDQDRLVYRVCSGEGRCSGEVGFYNHHRWAASPGRLVQTALVAGLRGTPGINAVEPTSANGSYSLLLAGRVIALEEVDLPGRQLARIKVDLKILDMDAKTVVRSRYVTVTAEGQAQEVTDIIRLMQGAFSKLVAEVRGELQGAITSSAAVISSVGCGENPEGRDRTPAADHKQH